MKRVNHERLGGGASTKEREVALKERAVRRGRGNSC